MCVIWSGLLVEGASTRSSEASGGQEEYACLCQGSTIGTTIVKEGDRPGCSSRRERKCTKIKPTTGPQEGPDGAHPVFGKQCRGKAKAERREEKSWKDIPVYQLRRPLRMARQCSGQCCRLRLRVGCAKGEENISDFVYVEGCEDGDSRSEEWE